MARDFNIRTQEAKADGSEFEPSLVHRARSMTARAKQ